jgi:hypothetical protein
MYHDISEHFWVFIHEINNLPIDDSYFKNNQLYKHLCRINETNERIHLNFSVFGLNCAQHVQHTHNETGFLFDNIHVLFKESAEIYDFVGNQQAAKEIRKCIKNMEVTLELLDENLFSSL